MQFNFDDHESNQPHTYPNDRGSLTRLMVYLERKQRKTNYIRSSNGFRSTLVGHITMDIYTTALLVHCTNAESRLKKVELNQSGHNLHWLNEELDSSIC